VVGVAAGTTPLGVQAIADGLDSELTTVIYPDSWIIGIQDSSGNVTNQLVDSSYMAAAVAGSTCAPSIDVGTPWTRRFIQGFIQPATQLDPVEANQVAVNGVTVLELVSAGIRIRHGLTTNVSSVITRTPSVTLIIQDIQQATRVALDPFIGQKFTGTTISSAQRAVTSMFGKKTGVTVSSVSGISVTTDPNDPTILDEAAIYTPIFPLEYIMSNMQVRVVQ
jgi:hypothetical protein